MPAKKSRVTAASTVTHPYTGDVIATVPKATVEDVKRALRIARGYRAELTRYERYRILMRAGEIMAAPPRRDRPPDHRWNRACA